MIDFATIKVKSGNGGDGIVSFRREKFIAKGGPWGGDGGVGGNIVFVVDPHFNTLTHLKRQSRYYAQNGGNGMKNRKKGADGEDLIIKVPPGTVVKDDEGRILCDLIEAGNEYIAQVGGQGGLGNWHFKSSTNQTPMQSTEGIKTDPRALNIELKLIADIGLIGLPSSGKSTLLNTLTRSRAKTAAYHFTTLEPNLGVLHIAEYIAGLDKDLVLADIPGLIEGASEGKGLGHDFLRHVERTRVLIHIIDGSEVLNLPINKLLENYDAIRNELGKWNKSLVEKPQILAINKIDITEVKEKMDDIKTAFEKRGLKPIFISAANREGLRELIEQIVDIDATVVEKEKEAEVYVPQKKTFDINNLPNKRIIFKRHQMHPHKFSDKIRA